jgi:hypothetical protein
MILAATSLPPSNLTTLPESARLASVVVALHWEEAACTKIGKTWTSKLCEDKLLISTSDIAHVPLNVVLVMQASLQFEVNVNGKLVTHLPSFLNMRCLTSTDQVLGVLTDLRVAPPCLGLNMSRFGHVLCPGEERHDVHFSEAILGDGTALPVLRSSECQLLLDPMSPLFIVQPAFACCYACFSMIPMLELERGLAEASRDLGVSEAAEERRKNHMLMEHNAFCQSEYWGKAEQVTELGEALKEQCENLERMRQEMIHLNHTSQADAVAILEDPSVVAAFKARPLLKTLFDDQVRMVACKDHRSMRWHPETLRFALMIYRQSAAHYERMRASGMIDLPSSRTMRAYKNISACDAGWNDEIPRMERCFLDAHPLHKKGADTYGNLNFDCMTIKGGICWDQSSQVMLGFVDVGDVAAEKELMDFLDDNCDGGHERSVPDLNTIKADKMLLMHWVTLNGDKKFKCPVAYFLVKTLSSRQLADLLLEGLMFLGLRGFWAACTVCDGGGENRGMQGPCMLVSTKVLNAIFFFISTTLRHCNPFPFLLLKIDVVRKSD